MDTTPTPLVCDPVVETANAATNAKIIKQTTGRSFEFGEDGRESTRCRCKIGESYDFSEVSFSNKSGGTVTAKGRVTAKVVARWWDYETGWHFAVEITAAHEPAIATYPVGPVAVPKCVRVFELDLVKPTRR